MAQEPTLLFIDIDGAGTLSVEHLAQELGGLTIEKLRSVNEALTWIGRRQPGLRYVVLDLGLRGEDMLLGIGNLVRACEGRAPLVAVGALNDLAFYRAVKSHGAQDYFVHPVDRAELRAALTQPQGLRASNLRGATGTVTAFMSAASGDGSSMAALNIAHAMAEQTGRDTVLVDLDYQFGMVARQLDLQAPFGIRELFDYPERGVDAMLISKMLQPYGERLHIIAAPDLLRMKPTIHPETVRELIRVLKSQYSNVLLDVPHAWEPWTAEALAQADRVVVVAQLWLRSLTHLSRLLAAWGEAGIDRNKVSIAINRSGARFREAITTQDFERVCLRSIDFHFPNDIKTVVQAENQGKTVVELGASPLERQLREAAARLGGVKAAAPDSSARTGLISRLIKRG